MRTDRLAVWVSAALPALAGRQAKQSLFVGNACERIIIPDRPQSASTGPCVANDSQKVVTVCNVLIHYSHSRKAPEQPRLPSRMIISLASAHRGRWTRIG